MSDGHFAEIDAVMLYVEEARARAERASKELKAGNAEPHLIAAVEAARADISDVARRLRQRTLFIAPASSVR